MADRDIGKCSFNEVGKTGTRCSTREKGVDVDDSNSPVDMDVSYDCELNFSTYFVFGMCYILPTNSRTCGPVYSFLHGFSHGFGA